MSVKKGLPPPIVEKLFLMQMDHDIRAGKMGQIISFTTFF